MAISSVNSNVNPNAAAAASALVSSSTALVNNANIAPTAQQASTVVSISQQGQALSRADNGGQSQQAQSGHDVNNPAAEGREGQAGEAAEKPGVQLLEGEKNAPSSAQGSRVNTYV